MVPDYIHVMLSLVRRDTKEVSEQWQLLTSLLDGVALRGANLDVLPRPQRDLLVRTLAEQVAIGLERLCCKSTSDGVNLATLKAALEREEAQRQWLLYCEVPTHLWDERGGQLVPTVKRLVHHDQSALEDTLYAVVPNLLGELKHALDGLSGELLGVAA